jgi:hypothetical protein
MNNVVESFHSFLLFSSLSKQKENQIKPNFFHNTSHKAVYYTES